MFLCGAANREPGARVDINGFRCACEIKINFFGNFFFWPSTHSRPTSHVSAMATQKWWLMIAGVSGWVKTAATLRPSSPHSPLPVPLPILPPPHPQRQRRGVRRVCGSWHEGWSPSFVAPHRAIRPHGSTWQPTYPPTPHTVVALPPSSSRLNAPTSNVRSGSSACEATDPGAA